MSLNCVQTKIKTTPGAKISTIENVATDIIKSGTVKEPAAIILHVGMNNITEGDSKESIVTDFSSLTKVLTSKYQKTKIIISSILPLKTMKITDAVINDVNEGIKSLCRQEGYIFLDNSGTFSSDKSLYFDEFHPNNKGTAALGSNMKRCIADHLSTTYKHDATSYFRHGRNNRRPYQTGTWNQWRNPRNTPMIPQRWRQM